MRANSPFSLHRHFIRLLWICFPVEKKTFSKYSYLPLLVIITITTIYIINKQFSQKNFYSNHQTVTWRCQFESLLVKMHTVAYLRPFKGTPFLRCKNCSHVGFWSEAPEQMFHIYPQKVFETSFKFLEIITSSRKILVKRKYQ